MSNAKISKLETQINEIMARPTYASTPAWQQEVAEIRIQIEAMRRGEEVERKTYSRPSIPAQGGKMSMVGLNPANDIGASAAAASADDHHDDHSAPYMGIFFALLFLTVLEWKAAPLFGIGGLTLWIALSVMAVVKALLVAFYFMHLVFERKVILTLLLLPVLLVLVMTILLLPDAAQQLLQYLPYMR